MLSSQLTSPFSKTFPTALFFVTHVQKRGVHRSSDYAYLQKGLQINAYKKLFEERSHQMAQYPQFMDRYFKASAVMKCKNKMPFVHAQNAMFRVAHIFLKEFCEANPSKNYFRYMRTPSAQFNIDKNRVMSKVEDYCKEHGESGWTPGEWNGGASRLDHDPEIRPFLISASYSLMDFSQWDSAFHFLFSNSSVTKQKEVKELANEAIATSMKMRGLKERIPEVVQTLEPYYEAYSKLQLGTLFVIGIPMEKIEAFAYDSKAFGIPSREEISQVAKAPGNSPRAYNSEEGGLQARIVIYKETLNPASGIEVIDVNDEEEVARFCEGFQLEPSEEVFKDSRIFQKKTSNIEKEAMQKQKDLDEKVKNFASFVKNRS